MILCVNSSALDIEGKASFLSNCLDQADKELSWFLILFFTNPNGWVSDELLITAMRVFVKDFDPKVFSKSQEYPISVIYSEFNDKPFSCLNPKMGMCLLRDNERKFQVSINSLGGRILSHISFQVQCKVDSQWYRTWLYWHNQFLTKDPFPAFAGNRFHW